VRRRKPTRRLRCATQPCGEVAYWEFDNQRDYVAHAKRVTEWRCLRHEHPGKVLGLNNLKTEWLSDPALPSERYPNIDRADLFFGGSGFLHGDGYNAYASDFPVGTRIRVTAEVLLPEPPCS
jgi:hypothetical protein